MYFRTPSLLLLLSLLTAGSAAELRREYAQTPAEALSELNSFAAGYTDAAGWQRRAGLIRQGILAGAGLVPLPVRCPLNPRLTAPRAHAGYVAENLAFESLPGFFVTGTLYRPAAGTGPFAAVLLPHGHFAEGNGGGRFHPDIQRLAATLARSGAVVFAYDMVGWGESTQYPHKDKGALTLQLWNSIRALDYLESRPDVDSRRLAVTGASGGGTQAFLLAAVDARVAVTVPVVQVSAYFFGGCECESGLPIHTGPAGRTNNAEIAALAAPRPQLIVSDGKDWTQHTPEIGFPISGASMACLGWNTPWKSRISRPRVTTTARPSRRRPWHFSCDTCGWTVATGRRRPSRSSRPRPCATFRPPHHARRKLRSASRRFNPCYAGSRPDPHAFQSTA